jgi:hypothetical protein
MSDRTHEQIIAALKQALAEPGEHRLYRSGKLAGLFASRAGAAGDAGASAVRDGLFEIVRIETKGKFNTEWVRLTPAGVEYLHAHESPLVVLRELQSALRATRTGVPLWLEQMRQQWQSFSSQMVEQMQQTLKRFDALCERVEEALRRADAIAPALPNGVASTVPWALEVLTYLDRRRETGTKENCPLPELFAAVRRGSPNLSLSEFQTGLRRLGDHKALRLLPFDGPADRMPHPEYALLDGASVLYYVSR